MQILLGANETIVKINSQSISIDYIQHFISTHFTNRKIIDNYILIPSSHNDIYHRSFLLKWLYSLYTKKNIAFPELKESLLQRHHKAIKIVTAKKIIHTITYKVVDKQNIKIQITPSNNAIAYQLKVFLQAKIQIMPTCLHVNLITKKEKNLLFKFMNSSSIIDVPHKHSYNKKDMEFFFFIKEEEKYSPMQDAYLILGISKNDNFKTIKRRYKLLAKEFHPDRVDIDDKQKISIYTKKFQTILGAYEIIYKNNCNSVIN